MVEGVISNLVAEAMEALAKAAMQEATSWWGAQDDLKKLEKTMRMIQARVRDAERRQEDENSDLIKVWLGSLRQVLYRVDDLFDAVLTLNRQKWLTEQSKRAKVGMLFSRSGPLYYNRKLAHEVRCIRKELDAIKSDMNGLNLTVLTEEQQLPKERLMKKRESSSFVKAEDVVGRENDKNMIIEMLFDPIYDREKLTVIPIMGFGGLGKTTLAQLVFNDERVQNHFSLTKWVCMPEVDNKHAVMEKVHKSFTGKNSSDLSLDEIKSGIRESINNKKYLLVLDDIWDESRDRWLDLLSLLECGQIGSKVIVTTRSDEVAKIVRTIPEAHKLGLLTDDESWDLFKGLAFKSGQGESDLILTQIGKEIVDRCGNVPLAIRVVGSLLYSKDSEKEWQLFKDDQLSKGKLMEDGNIMPMLKLSYDYLPPTLKQCFSYCSLFPKDYAFNKAELVPLWMAQGYLELSNRDIGDQYFMELLGRNFFQDPQEDDEGNVITCKMHDLVHDLAQQVAGDESMLLGESLVQHLSDGLVHVSVNLPDGDSSDEEEDGWVAPPMLVTATKMRSLVLRRENTYLRSCAIKASSLEGLISRFQSLRVLSLEDMWITRVPNSIGKLTHLRLLNLKGNNVRCLPDAITRLENLQTLNLHGCINLKELPRDFAKLANLKHLIICWDSLTDLPSGFGKMTSLHVLHRFEVGEGKNTGIDSLPALNLRGKLDIKFCKWHRDAVSEVQRASLKNNQQLTSLVLDLGFDKETIIVDSGEMDRMLTGLQLAPRLKYLKIFDYKGDEMPRRWLDSSSKLVSVNIHGCDNCKVLPHLSRLPHLKNLYLKSLKVLEYVEDEDDIWVGGEGGRFGPTAYRDYFPLLEVLELTSLPQLKGWTRPSQDDGEQRQLSFPRLLQMTVFNCPALMSMPLAPKLNSLVGRCINGKMFNSNLRSSVDDK